MPKGSAAAQRDPARLEEWLQDKNFIKFDQDKHNILHMRWTAPLHQDRLRCDWLGSSPTKKT